MTLEALLESLPDYAKDLRLNWSSLANASDLTDSQRWGCFIAAAYGARCPRLLAAVEAEAAAHVTPQLLAAAKGAAAIMSMNNIYYRFLHMVEDGEYQKLPARLRMNVIGNPGIDKLDFELLSLAVSAINGCGKCVSSHEKVLLEKGVTEEVILAGVRIAAVVHGIATTLDALPAA